MVNGIFYTPQLNFVIEIKFELLQTPHLQYVRKLQHCC